MKAVHASESAQMLLLITDTSQSNSLLVEKSGIVVKLLSQEGCHMLKGPVF